MKIKTDFITNSSSASFVIARSCLSKAQMYMIVNHIELAAAVEEDYEGKLYPDPWRIEIKDHVIEGDTSMDNFDMTWFLINVVKVDPKHIHFEGSNY